VFQAHTNSIRLFRLAWVISMRKLSARDGAAEASAPLGATGTHAQSRQFLARFGTRAAADGCNPKIAKGAGE